MRHQFFRMFLSIALIIFVLVMVQIAMVFVGNYRFLAENWKREVFEEFASSVRRAIQRIGSADNEAVISMIADSSSERVSGLILRDGNGDFVASLGFSPDGEEVPSPREADSPRIPSGRLSAFYQKKIDYKEVRIAPARYELAIAASGELPFVQSIDFRPIAARTQPSSRVSLPAVLTDQDIAGTIMVSFNGDPQGYIDVLVYKLSLYAPTAFALREIIVVFIISLPLSFLIALLLAALYSKRTERGVRDIQTALQKLSAGDFDIRLPRQNTVEMSEIASSIETLAMDLKRHQQSRKEWIRNISHDLNTPLASIQLLVDGAIDGIFPVDQEFLDKLKAEVGTLAMRISSVRYYSYLLSPDAEARKEHLSLPSAFPGDIIEGCTVDGDAVLDADPQLLWRAMKEIVENAREYGNPEESPFIKLYRGLGNGVIEVRNHGSLPKPLPQFFEPWARGDDSRTEGGSGMGLPIVYQIMDLHGGSITIGEKGGYVYVSLIFPDASSALPS